MLLPGIGTIVAIALIALLTFVTRLINDYYFNARRAITENQEVYYV